jgi:cysteinyl-tRNA synthetase
VYFDTVKFNSSKDHDYAKLAPWSAGNVKLVEEGEGDLASKATNKKTPSDFALWKNSKPGEPYWESPWGKGRPGWHIECSVMASAIIGDGMDIHGGGIDLMFPHHDNELAQSEAHFECKQWVNYFMHTGHLHIENLKMSKSLKNFLTISDTLKKTSSSQLRLMFLLHSWDTVFDYSASSISEAKIVESTIQNFLSLVNALSNETVTSQGHNYSTQEAELILNLQKKQDAVHAAICDSFNTPLAMNEIRGLISLANIYYADKQKLKQPPNIAVMYKIARYISRILRIFGLGENHDIIGTFGGAPKSSANLIPILKTMSEFRDNIRNLAQNKGDPKQILEVCDKFRDEDMIEHGVVLEDREGGNALVKLVDKELLQAQKEEQKMKLEIQKQLKLERKQKEQAQLEQRRLKAQLNPSDMFKTDEYSDWDEQGLPLKMKDGEQVTKSKRKKLLKEFEAQTKLYNEFNSK